MQDLINGRCGWCGTDELYVKYHDQEWGKLVTDDKKLFEFLVLESAQAVSYTHLIVKFNPDKKIVIMQIGRRGFCVLGGRRKNDGSK